MINWQIWLKCKAGDERYIYNTSLFDKAAYSYKWTANKDCYITHMDTEHCGRSAVILGAGREVKESVIDFTAGIKFYKKTGDYIKSGDIIAELYSSDKENLIRHQNILNRHIVLEVKMYLKIKQ